MSLDRECVYCDSKDVDQWASWNVAGAWTCAECTPNAHPHPEDEAAT